MQANRRAATDVCQQEGMYRRVERVVRARTLIDWLESDWLYWIISSARSKIDDGTVRPSVLAVLTLTAISHFTGT